MSVQESQFEKASGQTPLSPLSQASITSHIKRITLLRKMGVITLIAVVTLMLTEAAVRTAAYWAQAPQSYSKDFDIKYALARHSPKPGANTILLLGNSHIWHALYSELITHRLQKAGYSVDIRNLGVNGTTPKMNLFLLKSALKSGVRPKLVVYNVAPILLNHEYYTDPTATPEQAFTKSYLGQCYFLPHSKLSEKWACTLKKNLQIVRYREWVLQQITTLSQTCFLPANKPSSPVLGAPLTESSPTGWSPAYELVSGSFDSQFLAPRFLNAVKNGKSLSNFHWDLSHLQELKDFCQKEHIPFVMLWLPEHPTMTKIYKHFALPSMQNFRKQFQALSNPSKQLWFIDLSESDTNPDHFYNPDHLNVLGALPISENFAQILLKDPYKQLLTPPSQGSAP